MWGHSTSPHSGPWHWSHQLRPSPLLVSWGKRGNKGRFDTEEEKGKLNADHQSWARVMLPRKSRTLAAVSSWKRQEMYSPLSQRGVLLTTQCWLSGISISDIRPLERERISFCLFNQQVCSLFVTAVTRNSYSKQYKAGGVVIDCLFQVIKKSKEIHPL